MRRNRIIWFCLWILSLVGISFYGGIISYGFFIAVTITPVFSLFYLPIFYSRHADRRLYLCCHKIGKFLTAFLVRIESMLIDGLFACAMTIETTT